MDQKHRHDKLVKLAEIEGFENKEALLQACIADTVCPGICTNPPCEYTTEVDPDQREGWCEECDMPTVKSALVLAGLI